MPSARSDAPSPTGESKVTPLVAKFRYAVRDCAQPVPIENRLRAVGSSCQPCGASEILVSGLPSVWQ